MSLGEHMHLSLLDIYLWMEFLGQKEFTSLALSVSEPMVGALKVNLLVGVSTSYTCVFSFRVMLAALAIDVFFSNSLRCAALSRIK